VSKDPIGADFIRTGEAAVSIDPLSSQGIQVALVSAVQGAAAVHTILTDDYDAAEAIEFFRERQQSAAARGRIAAARLYGENPVENAFWSSRSFIRDAPRPDRL
jgi:2-polyprenyl-6-methoxyphenol hydroxylase-like FAD-dependent oxidoreductase